MIDIALLLGAALGTGFTLLGKVTGLEAKADEWGEKLAKPENQVHQNDLEKAIQQAAQKSGVEGRLKTLLDHPPFQQQVVRALLDPNNGFDLEAATQEWTGKFPNYESGLRKFFIALQNILTFDEYWGGVIERYQNLKDTPEAQKAIAEKRLPATELELVQQVSAELYGDGTLAQGNGNIVVGKNGVLIQGNQNQFIQQIAEKIYNQNYHFEAHTHIQAPSDEDKKQDKLLRRYLEKQRLYCNTLPLAAMGGEESSEAEITLDQVYIDLDTTTRISLSDKEKEESKRQALVGRNADDRPVSALEAFSKACYLVLLGEPGGGKSTFARHLLAWQAAVQLGEAKHPLKRLDPRLLPVILVLRDLTPQLLSFEPQKLSDEKQQTALLEIFWKTMFQSLEAHQIETFQAQMIEQFENKNVFLVLDGLDEVPQDLRRLVRRLVGVLLKEYRLPRVLVTCRVRSYQDDAVLPDFESYTLEKFDSQKIRRFVKGWYVAQVTAERIKKGDAEKRIADLSRAALSKDLSELSGNPMMLTTMAIIHQKEIGLPRERVRLYNLAVDVLMRRWQRYKFSEQDVEAFLNDELRLRRAMERLAYETHKTGLDKKASSDLSRGRALEILESSDYLGKPDLAAAFLDHVDQRAGLLVGQGGAFNRPVTYSFPHRTFQEYLAGCYMVGRRDICREFYARAGEGDYWNLAAQLGTEELYYNRRSQNTLLDLAYQLCPAEPPANEQSLRATLWSGQMAVLVKKDTIEQDHEAPGGGQNYLSRMIERLLKIMREGLPPIERADAGNTLARLGDPRAEVMSVEGMRFCHVPAGKFWMGSDDGDGDEKPKHKLELPEFWISQYPITQAQFDRFVLAGGYENKTYWTEAEAAGYWSVEGFKEGSDQEPRKSNQHFSEPFDLPNYPVVGVSWYEALAFCRWLQDQMQKEGQFWNTNKTTALVFKKGWRVQLPSEAEWEKAARGLDGQIYPWGNEFDANKANMGETGIGTTSAVGCFPLGGSPYGVLDMSGNVYEWTRSLKMDYPYQVEDERENLKSENSRVLRGGSFFDIARWARCAFRGGSGPYGWGYDLGFRIVLSPPAS